MIRFCQQLNGCALHNEISQLFRYASITSNKGKIEKKPKQYIQGTQLNNEFIKNSEVDDDPNYSMPLFEQENPQYFKKKKSQSKYGNYKLESTPNLLTWAEKEKIRSLHQDQPTEWTPERLAGNFPATPSIIRRIIKKKWEPRDVSQHDKAVFKHWQQLIAGEIQVSPTLKRHLLTFTPRKNMTKEPTKNENLSEEQMQEKVDEEQRQEKDNDQPSVSIEHALVQNQKADTSVRKDHINWSDTGSITKYQTRRVKTEQQKPLYPERIRIPKEKWQEGATYKVGDVYYDSDGEFLYRVPGMS